MAKLKDVAEKCNVSLSTVSKVLNGSREIGEQTSKRVRAAAEELGYQPNSAARALKTSRTYNIGVIFEDKTNSGLQHGYFATIFDSLKVEAESRGYDITFISNNLGGQDNYFKHTRYRGCDGIAMVVVDYSKPDIIQLLTSGIPVTTLDHVVDGHTAVVSDNAKGMRKLTEHVVSLGHRRIAFIYGEDTDVTSQRLESFLEVCGENGISVPADFLLEGMYHEPGQSEEATRALLAMKEPPTCILYPDDFAILGGIKVIQEMQLEIGRDISVAGYDGILLSRLLHPPLTTYRQNGEMLGKQMAYQLIRNIESSDSFSPEIVSVPGELIPGASVCDLNLK